MKSGRIIRNEKDEFREGLKALMDKFHIITDLHIIGIELIHHNTIGSDKNVDKVLINNIEIEPI